MATSLLGAWLIRREGAKAWRALDQAARSGRMPTREIADGIVVLVGGGLLLVPGFVTDVVGLVLVLPFVRPVARNLLAAVISRRLVTQTMSYTNLTVTEAPEAPEWEQHEAPEGPQRSTVERRRRRGRDHRRGLNPATTAGRELRALRDGIPNRGAGDSKEPASTNGAGSLQGSVVEGQAVLRRRGFSPRRLAQQRQALLEELLELGDGTTLEEHVPVRALVLDRLRLGLGATALELRVETAAALPRGRHVGLDGEGELGAVALGADVRGELALTRYDVLVGFHAPRTEVGTA